MSFKTCFCGGKVLETFTIEKIIFLSSLIMNQLLLPKLGKAGRYLKY